MFTLRNAAAASPAGPSIATASQSRRSVAAGVALVARELRAEHQRACAVGVLGRAREQALDRRLGRAERAGAQLDAGQTRERRGVLRRQREGGIQRSARVVRIAEPVIEQRRDLEVQGRPLVDPQVEADQRLTRGDRLAPLCVLHVGAAKRAVGLEVPGLQAERAPERGDGGARVLAVIGVDLGHREPQRRLPDSGARGGRGLREHVDQPLGAARFHQDAAQALGRLLVIGPQLERTREILGGGGRALPRDQADGGGAHQQVGRALRIDCHQGLAAQGLGHRARVTGDLGQAAHTADGGQAVGRLRAGRPGTPPSRPPGRRLRSADRRPASAARRSRDPARRLRAARVRARAPPRRPARGRPSPSADRASVSSAAMPRIASCVRAHSSGPAPVAACTRASSRSAASLAAGSVNAAACRPVHARERGQVRARRHTAARAPARRGSRALLMLKAASNAATAAASLPR